MSKQSKGKQGTDRQSPPDKLTITHKSAGSLVICVGFNAHRWVGHCVTGQRCQQYHSTAATLAR